MPHNRHPQRVSLRIAASALLIGCANLAAATLCVNQSAPPGCFSTISDAVKAAHDGDRIQVAPGTYAEDVVITKNIALLGADQATTIIDATGLPNAVYIDGLDRRGLHSVVVQNFTLANANFEGLLATNASQLTIGNNHVINNDRSLNPAGPTCPGIPSFETAEDFDCGEGVHVMGITDSFVVNNLIENNAGGILISDDTGRTARNLVAGNVVRNNPFDCGITIPSHPPAMITGAHAPFGIVGNTITNNEVSSNGLSGEGAGVGVFTFLPGGTVAFNVISFNRLVNNGLPGIAMHAHGPGENLNNNRFIGNTISGNGPDTDDAATPGPTGINIFGVSPIMNLVIMQNTITDEDVDVAIKTPAITEVHNNNLLGTGIGVDNLGFTTVLAERNYWGCPTGPNTPGCTTTVGNVVSFPFLKNPVTF